MPGMHVKFEISPDHILADLTEAAYKVALQFGFKVPFIDVELDLYEALRQVIRKDMSISLACGEIPGCSEAKQFEPWSDEAKKIFREG